MNKKFEKLGFYPADILLPKDQDMTKWAVVACDQFTSEPEYWQAVEQTVGDAPSTLRLILPEANLKAPNVDEYIAVMYQGIPQMAVGRHTDVLDACPKAVGIPILLRAANPQIIAVDEITVREDLLAMAAAANCGVRFLATIHAAGRQELGRRPLFSQLLKVRVFEKAVTIRREGGQRQYIVEELW